MIPGSGDAGGAKKSCSHENQQSSLNTQTCATFFFFYGVTREIGIQNMIMIYTIMNILLECLFQYGVRGGGISFSLLALNTAVSLSPHPSLPSPLFLPISSSLHLSHLSPDVILCG